MSTYLVTGANRGIGYELVHQLCEDATAKVVIAGCRNPGNATKLHELQKTAGGKLHIVALDITDEEQAKKAAKEVEQLLPDGKLDVLINNAGQMHPVPRVVEVTGKDLVDHFQINCVGVHNVMQAFLPLLEKGETKKIIQISAGLGSLNVIPTLPSEIDGAVAYGVSKAALNALSQFYAKELGPRGFKIVSIHPGVVQTDMLAWGRKAQLTPEESVKGILKVTKDAGSKDNGTFVDWLGKTYPW